MCSCDFSLGSDADSEPNTIPDWRHVRELQLVEGW